MLDVADSVVIDLVVGLSDHLFQQVDDQTLHGFALYEVEDDRLEKSEHRSKGFSKSL